MRSRAASAHVYLYICVCMYVHISSREMYICMYVCTYAYHAYAVARSLTSWDRPREKERENCELQRKYGATGARHHATWHDNYDVRHDKIIEDRWTILETLTSCSSFPPFCRALACIVFNVSTLRARARACERDSRPVVDGGGVSRTWTRRCCRWRPSRCLSSWRDAASCDWFPAFSRGAEMYGVRANRSERERKRERKEGGQREEIRAWSERFSPGRKSRRDKKKTSTIFADDRR